MFLLSFYSSAPFRLRNWNLGSDCFSIWSHLFIKASGVHHSADCCEQKPGGPGCSAASSSQESGLLIITPYKNDLQNSVRIN